MIENEVYRISCTITGTRPLLQNEMAVEDSKATKSGKVYDDVEEAKKRLIMSNGLICQKADHIESALIKAGSAFKFKGQKTYKDLLKAGIQISPEFIPHKIQDFIIDKRMVRIGPARIARCRPRFEKWELDFDIIVTDDRISPLNLQPILEDSGKSYGIGDFRPKFGLFKVTKFEVVKPEALSEAA